MDRQQKRKQPCITTDSYDKNARWRELYRDMATAKKNTLLLQRRLKKREATTNRLLGSIKSINLAESMCAIQDNVIVGGSCSISKRVATDREVFTPLNVLDKGKNVIHSISTFENGLTSSTSGKSSSPNTETILVDVANTIAFNSRNEVKETSK
uniref:Uncharacterized protein LOC104211469 n=1 Tax=Nicotiana sylvestris TaxID=4096 RepID=A0A1U7UXC6_NICSY|nr:PREDICTED: uncharacterized protein LOC104211469 [Nicotiana sylvestris]